MAEGEGFGRGILPHSNHFGPFSIAQNTRTLKTRVSGTKQVQAAPRRFPLLAPQRLVEISVAVHSERPRLTWPPAGSSSLLAAFHCCRIFQQSELSIVTNAPPVIISSRMEAVDRIRLVVDDLDYDRKIRRQLDHASRVYLTLLAPKPATPCETVAPANPSARILPEWLVRAASDATCPTRLERCEPGTDHHRVLAWSHLRSVPQDFPRSDQSEPAGGETTNDSNGKIDQRRRRCPFFKEPHRSRN